ncbi:MAG: hypothetical protein ACI854_001553 [Arenicella sp.]|jgi:hypothetical protein
MSNFQKEKKLVREYFTAMEQANTDEVAEVLASFTSDDYLWRGVYPFREQQGASQAAANFWVPLKKALSRMQRREDIFIAGDNKYAAEVWVMSMGNFMGLFDQDILGIPRTRKLVNLRYAEFSCVENGKITKTGLFVDLIGLMVQAGVNPLPPSTGAYFNCPGPRTHDGLNIEDAPAEQADQTMDLLNRMVDDLSALNDSGAMGCTPEVLERTWSKDMVWYGPAGIGSTYTIERYQEQHQLPFRQHLEDKKFQGHVCRFAEGNYACFFGWPNLSNTPIGGWLGLPGGGINCDMQVVDVYRRDGEKLIENWVLLDIPYWLSQQGLDVFKRTAGILNPDYS